MKRLISLILHQLKTLGNPLKWVVCLLVLALSSHFSHAQKATDVIVRAGFFKDSLIVGDQTGFYVSARYPKEKSLVFPDSTFAFTPFEYERRTYFPTETKGGVSYDSVIYYLSTFEIDRVQRLKLPVYELLTEDSVTYYSNEDSILLTPLVTMALDTIPAEALPLKRNVAYQNVSFLFNYPVATIILSVLIVLTALSWFFFGKKIKRYFQARRMQRAHASFTKAFSDRITQIKETFSPQSTEAALVLWKKYMEQLESKPYTKLTTRETRMVNPDSELIKSLTTIDGAIYGAAHPDTLVNSLEQLQVFANTHFEARLKNVNHGR